MIYLDFETKSFADLAKVGTKAYAQDPTTEVICLCWRIDDGEPGEWWPGLGKPWHLLNAINDGHEVEAFHVAFEYCIWTEIMVKRHGWCGVPFESWRDLMAVACYLALPAQLDKLARALGFEGKDKRGGQLITKYSKLYLKTAKQDIPDDDFFAFVDYCHRDVEQERLVSLKLGKLPPAELEIFQHDFAVNIRGLSIDMTGVEVASSIVAERAAKLAQKFRTLTNLNPGQGAKIHEWAAAQGFPLENLQKDYLQELLDGDELPQGPVRKAIEIRLKINKASTKKLDAMARQTDAEGRACFQTRYHGAVTGRNTGSGFQPLNLNRGWEDEPPERLVKNIMRGSAEWLDLLYGDATDAVAKASRHWIVPKTSNRIFAGDFVSVEAVGLACLAGEEWKIQAFRDGVKIYEHMGDKIYGLPPGTVTKKTHPQERFDGKTGELAFGYGGGLGAWLKFDSSGRHSDERIHEIKNTWREEHPETVSYWKGLENASIDALHYPGDIVEVGTVAYQLVPDDDTKDGWLTCILPDGKRIWYRSPKVLPRRPPWHKPSERDECATGECDCGFIDQLTYLTYKGGTWFRTGTYGGKLSENVTQATCRQILKAAELRVQRAGYNVILSVYDEVIAEVPKGFGSLEHFTDLMQEKEEWFADWPITCDPWEGLRYKK